MIATIKYRTLLATAIGVFAIIWQLVQFDIQRVMIQISDLGFGIIWVILSYLPLAMLTAQAWYCLLTINNNKLSLAQLFWYRLVADAVNQLLPTAQIGGEILRGHFLVNRGLASGLAYASVLVDTTAAFFSLIVFLVFGFSLAAHSGASSLVFELSFGGLFFILVFMGLYLSQRAGLLGWLATFSERFMVTGLSERFRDQASALDIAVREIYRAPLAVSTACFWRLLAWFGGTAQIGLILWLMGESVDFKQVLIIEAFGQASRNLGFFIPAALGAQEAGYVLGVTAVGINPEIGLAISVVKRLRDLLLGLPVLILWQKGNLSNLFKA